MDNLPLSKAHLRFVDPAIREQALEGLTRGRPGILVAGNVGTGKTFLLRAIADRFGSGAMLGSAVQWIGDFRSDAARRVPRHFGHERVAYNPARYQEGRDVIDRGVDCQLALIDDLGAHRPTDFAEEQLYRLIDERLANGRLLVVATNERLDQIRETNPRVADRLRVLKPILMLGKSRRQAP